jgi:spore maturation protein CgeB
MLAERTDEHLEWFQEGRDIACFDSPEEMHDKVKYYLARDEQRQRIAAAGHRAVTGAPHTYRDRVSGLLRLADVMQRGAST